MVNFQGFFIGRNAAQFTPKLRPLQNLISQGTGYVALALSPMLPNTTATFCDVFGDLLLAKRDEAFKFLGRQFIESLQAVFVIDAFSQTSVLCENPPNHILCYLLVILYLGLVISQ